MTDARSGGGQTFRSAELKAAPSHVFRFLSHLNSSCRSVGQFPSTGSTRAMYVLGQRKLATELSGTSPRTDKWNGAEIPEPEEPKSDPSWMMGRENTTWRGCPRSSVTFCPLRRVCGVVATTSSGTFASGSTAFWRTDLPDTRSASSRCWAVSSTKLVGMRRMTSLLNEHAGGWCIKERTHVHPTRNNVTGSGVWSQFGFATPS
jgi:hypothetical protein